MPVSLSTKWIKRVHVDLTLERQSFNSWGIVSLLKTAQSDNLVYCLEHAFAQPDGSFAPVIPNGIFQCVKGLHKLKDDVPFLTFEVTGIDGHSGLLFHPGNYNQDSEGCILLGTELGDEMILNSRIAFTSFMLLQAGLGSFALTVTAPSHLAF